MNHDEMVNIVSEAYNYSEKLYSGMNTLINNIDNRNLIDLEIYFKNILEGFNWILEVAILVSDIHNEKLDLDNIQEKVTIYVEGYNNIDLLFVRDVVQYELMPQVEIFYNIFNKVLSILKDVKSHSNSK